MALPSNFSEAENLQDCVLKVVNREVREWFRDVGPDDWEPDLNSDRARLRIACTHKEADSLLITNVRLNLFQVVVGQAAAYQPPIFDAGGDEAYDPVTGHPKITLFFMEKFSDAEDGFFPLRGKVSFRLMDETSHTITTAKLTQLANRIKTLFGASGGYSWHKGWYKYVYQDLPRGYDFRILAYNETVAKNLISKTLDIQNHSPDWDKLNKVEPENAASRFPANPGTQIILGKSRRKARQRPRAYVKFRYAAIHIEGIALPITLYDISGLKRKAIAS